MARFLPGERFLGARFGNWINPGPFNVKEHVAIIIMSSTAVSSASAISVFAVDELYYNIYPNCKSRPSPHPSSSRNPLARPPYLLGSIPLSQTELPSLR